MGQWEDVGTVENLRVHASLKSLQMQTFAAMFRPNKTRLPSATPPIYF